MRLCELSGNPDGTPGRDQVKRWETGKVVPGDYWVGLLASALGVPSADLEQEARATRAERRAAHAAHGVAVSGPRKAELLDMLAAVAGGDESYLSRNIGPYDLSIALANLADRDQGTKRRLVRWLDGGSTSLLRGNAQGTLFKTHHPDLIERAEQSMRHDQETRRRCMRCFTRRTFGLSWPDAARYTAVAAPAAELHRLGRLLHDPHDVSNRWCAAVFLGEAVEGGSAAARALLVGALHTEPSRETLRAIGLGLNGERPWN
ncbi:hypothetical protein [Kitasatospora sp. NPDC057198]|uniref:hypothetical protein n=1 Tax=Kitasatospora sp. NPDC057198 TaxID=3346046 RepID=UPI003643093C